MYEGLHGRKSGCCTAHTEIRNLDGTVQYLPKIDPNFKFVILSKFAPFRHYRKVYTMENEKIQKPVSVMSCTGCFSMIRTRLLKSIHGFDRRYFMYLKTQTFHGASDSMTSLSIILACMSITHGSG